MAHQQPKPLSYDERVEARKRLFAEIDKPSPGPVKVEAQRLGNGWRNVLIDGEPPSAARSPLIEAPAH
jgi:hypothetical protein